MPAWLQSLIPNIPIFVVALGLYPACFKVFAWVEDRLSPNAKQEISDWLKSAGNIAGHKTLSYSLFRFHCELFGDKQFSVKCISLTAIFSFLSFIVVFFPFVVQLTVFFVTHKDDSWFVFPGGSFLHIFGNDFISYATGIIYLLILFMFVILPIDFLGVSVTRILAKQAGNESKRVLLIFVYDTVAKALFFPFILFFSMMLIISLLIIVINEYSYIYIGIKFPLRIFDFSELFVITFQLQFIDILIWNYRDLYMALLPSFLLCSSWVWLYLVGSHLLRRVLFLFDVEKQPVRSIGVIGAAVLTGCYALYSIIFVNITFGEGYNANEIAKIQQQTPDFFSVNTLDEAIRRHPKSAGFYFIRGNKHADKRDYDLAIVDYTEAIKL